MSSPLLRLRSILRPRTAGVVVGTVVRVANGRAYLASPSGTIDLPASPRLHKGARVLVNAHNEVVGKAPGSLEVPTFSV